MASSLRPCAWTLGLLAACGDTPAGPSGGSGTDDPSSATGDESDADTNADADTNDDDDDESGETSDDASSSADGSSSESGPPPAGIECGTPFEHEGRSGCETVVEGIAVKFFPPPAGTPVQRLAVYFHGDGADDYTANWGFGPDILAWAEARDTMVMGVLSPAYYEDGTVAFGAAQPEHANAIALAIEAFIAAYEPEHADGTLYWATSGGSWFFSSSFIAAVGHRIPGVFVANCGGAGFSFGWAWDPMTDTTTRDKIPVYFNYGTEDFLAPGIVDSIAEYTGLGFAVDSLVHQGAMHCDHPINEPTIEFWSRYVP